MDLAKIIDELRLELQCVDSAIASMEELIRLQALHAPEAPATSLPEPAADPAVKRGRGRPRKNSLPLPGPGGPGFPLEDPAVPSD
jgi:hypothetical protein